MVTITIPHRQNDAPLITALLVAQRMLELRVVLRQFDQYELIAMHAEVTAELARRNLAQIHISKA